VEETQQYEQQLLSSKLRSDWKRKLIIFGASALGLKTLRGLQHHSILPLAFADNDPGKCNRELGGLPVLTPAQALRQFGAECSFIVCVWRSGPVMDQLKSLECTSVAEFKGLFWHMPDEFLPYMRVDRPHLLLQDASAIQEVFELLSDEDSRVEYVRQIRWLLNYDFGALEPQNANHQYFEDLFEHNPKEIFVDCGAYTGDTLTHFLQRWPDFRAIHAFEPEPENVAGLEDWYDRQASTVRKRVTIHRFAVSDAAKVLRFASDGVGSSERTDGELRIQAVRLDDALAGESVTFIKMDIEGG